MLSDPVMQVIIVGIVANASGAGVALYLWNQQGRREHYLLFWALAWITGTVRFAIHTPADANAVLRSLESAVLFPMLLLFNALGSYDLLPAKPWKSRYVVAVTAAVLVGSGIIADAVNRPIEISYTVVSAVFLFDAICLWVAYRQTKLSGHALASITFLCWSIWFALGLTVLGRALATSIIGPLFNIPAALALVIIAYQRRGRQLAESEHTLQKIFETAPAPIVIVRPPAGEIERANEVAFEMLGLPSDVIGKTAVEAGLVPDPDDRHAIYQDLIAGRRVASRELEILRAGIERRTVSVNADRIGLEAGDRYIFSFFDLTDLRRAESELRRSGDEMRQLYVRLANVEDDERRALHAELHDQVGANLSALRLELDVATSLLAADQRENAQSHLQSAREVAAETIAVARDLMAALRPPALDDYGLVAALRTFAESQAARLNLSISVSGNDLVPRPGSLVESALFRIAQEALINAARHARATRVVVEIEEHDHVVRLRISDDGIGFDPELPGVGPDHWGLRNMRERASAIGGRLHVATATGAGTRVTAEAPRVAQ